MKEKSFIKKPVPFYLMHVSTLWNVANYQDIFMKMKNLLGYLPIFLKKDTSFIEPQLIMINND